MFFFRKILLNLKLNEMSNFDSVSLCNPRERETVRTIINYVLTRFLIHCSFRNIARCGEIFLLRTKSRIDSSLFIVKKCSLPLAVSSLVDNAWLKPDSNDEVSPHSERAAQFFGLSRHSEISRWIISTWNDQYYWQNAYCKSRISHTSCSTLCRKAARGTSGTRNKA